MGMPETIFKIQGHEKPRSIRRRAQGLFSTRHLWLRNLIGTAATCVCDHWSWLLVDSRVMLGASHPLWIASSASNMHRAKTDCNTALVKEPGRQVFGQVNAGRLHQLCLAFVACACCARNCPEKTATQNVPVTLAAKDLKKVSRGVAVLAGSRSVWVRRRLQSCGRRSFLCLPLETHAGSALRCSGGRILTNPSHVRVTSD